MLLAIDIGNTTFSLVIFKGNKIFERASFLQPLNSKALEKELLSIKKKYNKLNKVIICSVVPGWVTITEKAIKKVFKILPLVVGRDIKVPIKNKYKTPQQVGQDRLVCSFAAKCLFGNPLIVIDLGTAITLDVVSKKGEYLGGMILPGIKMSTESLFIKTALLPKVENIEKPKSLIGKDTEGSILSGIFFGYGAMICGLIELLSKKIKARPKVIVTGGYAKLMQKFIGVKVSKIEQDLVFKGLLFLLDKC